MINRLKDNCFRLCFHALYVKCPPLHEQRWSRKVCCSTIVLALLRERRLVSQREAGSLHVLFLQPTKNKSPLSGATKVRCRIPPWRNQCSCSSRRSPKIIAERQCLRIGAFHSMKGASMCMFFHFFSFFLRPGPHLPMTLRPAHRVFSFLLSTTVTGN